MTHSPSYNEILNGIEFVILETGYTNRIFQNIAFLKKLRSISKRLEDMKLDEDLCTQRMLVYKVDDDHEELSLASIFNQLIYRFVKDMPHFCACLGMPYNIEWDTETKTLTCQFESIVLFTMEQAQ